MMSEKRELPETFTTWPLSMVSGHAVQQSVKYHGIEYKPDWWYMYGDVENAADHVYHGCSKEGHKSEGFGGSRMRFELVDGREIFLNGPWKCASNYMAKDAGKDISDRYFTRCVISTDRGKLDYNGGGYFGTTEYRGILHLDEDWVLGEFGRGKSLAQALANKHQTQVFYHVETKGGSHSGSFKPESHPLPDTEI